MYGIIYMYTCTYVYCESFLTSSFLSTQQILFKIICDKASEKGQYSTKFTETKCYDDFSFIFLSSILTWLTVVKLLIRRLL